MPRLTLAGLLLAVFGGHVAVLPQISDSYTLVKMALIGAAGALAWIGLTRSRLTTTPLDRPLAALGAAMLLSAAFSVDPPISVLGVHPQPFYGLLPLGMCAALYYAAAAGPEDHTENVLTAGLLAVVPMALFGFWQRAYGDPITHEELPTGLRITSTIGNPVMLGACLSLLLPAALHRTLARRGPLGPASGALLLAALWLTLARGAWVSGAVAAAAYLWCTGKARPTKKQWLALLVCAPLALWGLQRALHKKNSDSLRIETLKTGLAGFAARPIVGWGPDTFMIAFRRYKTEEFLRVAHNSPTVQYSAHNDLLQAAVTWGALGLAAYLWLLWVFGLRLWRAASAGLLDGEKAAMAAGLLGLFVQAKLNPIPISALATAAVMAGLLCREGKEVPVRTGRTAAAAGILFCAACALLYGRFCRADFLSRRGQEIVYSTMLTDPLHLEGVNDLRRSTELNPWNLEYLLKRCNNLFRTIDAVPPEQGLQLLEKSRQLAAEAVRLHPGNPMAHELRSTALALSSSHGENTLREAQREIQLASEMDPSFVFSLRRRMDIARALGDREDFERAKAQYIRVSTISGERADWTPLLH